MEIAFTVHGEAKPAGSKVSGVIFRKGPGGKKVPVYRDNGSPMTFTKDTSGAAGKDWRTTIQAAAMDAYVGPLLEGPLEVEMTFFRVRPKSHFGTGRNAGVVKASSPEHPITKPDVTKLVRAAEDALTGVLWRDDSQIVSAHTHKRYGDSAKLEILVRTIDREAVGEQVPEEQVSLLRAA